MEPETKVLSVILIFIVLLVLAGVYNGYLEDRRDLEFADKGLQAYQVVRCSSASTVTEWHEAGWQDKRIIGE